MISRHFERAIKGYMTPSNWFIYILSLRHEQYTRCDKIARSVWIRATDRSHKILPRQQWFSQKITVSHEANCCGDLSPRRVVAICGLVCLGLYTCWTMISAMVHIWDNRTYKRITEIVQPINFIESVIYWPHQRSFYRSSCYLHFSSAFLFLSVHVLRQGNVVGVTKK